MTRGRHCRRGNWQICQVVAGLLYVMLSISSATGQDTGSSDGSASVTCSPPADLSEAVSGGLFESGTQIAYTSLPFKGSGSTTCWHVVVAANCSRMEPFVLGESPTRNATIKVQLQVLRESSQHYEVVDHVTTSAVIQSAEKFCSNVEQSRQMTISFDAKLNYSDGHFPGIYFQSNSEFKVGVAYGGKHITCNSLVSPAIFITTFNRGKSQLRVETEFSFPGGETCFHPPLFTVSVIADKTDTPIAIPTLLSQETAVKPIPVATSTSTGTSESPLTSIEVDGMNSASSVRADVTIISAATATATAVVLIAMAIIVTLIIVGLLICRKQKVRAYQVKSNTGADSIKKTPEFAAVRGYPESTELKYYEEIMCSQASDYLTPVSCGGPDLNKTNYMNLSDTGKGDTMNTIGEYQVMHPIPEVVMDRSPCYGWVVPTLDQRNKLQQDGSTDGQYSTLEPYYAVSSFPVPVTDEQVQDDDDDGDDDVTESDSYWTPSMLEEEIYSQMHYWKYREIPRSIITLGNKLGEGEFGQVYSGQLQSAQNGPARDIAVKMTKNGAPQEERVKLLQEAATLGQFRHKHIVWLAGVVTLGEPKMIVMELVPGGDLRGFLTQTKQILVREGEGSMPDLPGLLLRFCHQVAEGLSFLAHKSFVHRDIAARNVLLDKELNCKISDFGMSRDLEEGTYYVTKGGQIPIRWTAPEAILYKKYSTSSDVWSYGMLMYEIWSLGHKPFHGIPLQQVAQILNENQGYCQPPPPGCPRTVYAIMVECWNPNHNARPSAIGVVVKLTQPESTLLALTEEEKEALSGGCKLGAPLEKGENMFKDLQETYA